MKVKVHKGRFTERNFIADVEACVHCGENHADLSFSYMKSPTLNGNTPYFYWADCPTDATKAYVQILVSLDNLEYK